MTLELGAPISGPELVALLKDEGIETAYQRFHEDYYSSISKAIRGRLSRHWRCSDPNAHGDELCQECIVLMYRQMLRVASGENPKGFDNLGGYVFTIYSRLIFEHVKRHARFNDAESVVDPETGFERVYVESREETDLLLMDVTMHLAALPTKQRIMAELWGYGCSHDEIAEALEITPELSRVWLFRIRKELAKKGLEL